MKLTNKKVMDVAADLSTSRNMEFAKFVENESGATQMTMVFMLTTMHVVTAQAICKKLGLLDDNAEIEISKNQFITAQVDVLSDISNDPQMPLTMTIEAMMFGNLLTTALFDNGGANA